MQRLQALWEQGGQPWIIAYEIAGAWARLGDGQRAFDWLNRLFAARCSMLIWLKIDPLFDSLRNDPQFQELVRQVGLE